MEQLRLRGRLIVSSAILFLVLVGGLLILIGLDVHAYLQGSPQASRTGYEKLPLIPVLLLPFFITWDETLPGRRKKLAFALVAWGNLVLVAAAAVWFLTAGLFAGPGPILRLVLLVALALGAGAPPSATSSSASSTFERPGEPAGPDLARRIALREESSRARRLSGPPPPASPCRRSRA